MDESRVRRTRRGDAGARTHPARGLLLGLLTIGAVAFLVSRGADPFVLAAMVVIGLTVGAGAAANGWR